MGRKLTKRKMGKGDREETIDKRKKVISKKYKKFITIKKFII